MQAFIQRESPKNGFKAIMEDGSSFFILNSVFSRLGLSVGQKLTEEEFYVLQDKVNYISCRNKALLLLAIREHGRKELEIKLYKKSFDNNIIKKTLDKLEEENLLSDYRFTVNFTESRLRRKPEGKDILLRRLIQKGISRETAFVCLNKVYTEEKIIELIGRVVAKKNITTVEGEAFWHLRKLGFSSHDIAMYKDLL